MLGDSLRRRQSRRYVSDTPDGFRRANWKRRLLYFAAAVLAPLLIGYLVAVFVMFPPTEVAGSGIPVPDLVGMTVPEAQRALVAAGLGEMDVTELPHPEADAGRIVAQSPLPGQQLRHGVDVRVAVSSGRARIVIPDVLGFNANRAETMLRRAGFTVERRIEESPGAEGRVIRTEPEPGQSLVLPASVTLIVSAGPAAVPDTIVPDTLPAVTVPDTLPVDTATVPDTIPLQR